MTTQNKTNYHMIYNQALEEMPNQFSGYEFANLAHRLGADKTLQEKRKRFAFLKKNCYKTGPNTRSWVKKGKKNNTTSHVVNFGDVDATSEAYKQVQNVFNSYQPQWHNISIHEKAKLLTSLNKDELKQICSLLGWKIQVRQVVEKWTEI